jgi:hypothetical protein
MARITALVLTGILASVWAAGASAENSSKANSSSSAPKTTTSSTTSSAAPPSAPRPSTTTPAQRIDNIVNYGAVKTGPNPGAVNRITPSGTQPMTPNAQASRGLRTNPVPSPTNSNARINTQGRNVNPTGDKKIAAGYDRNQQRYQANQAPPKPAATKPAAKPVTTANASNTRAWPGPTRPATSPAIKPSTATAPAPARPAVTAVARPASPPPPPPARSSSYTAASSSSTATTTKKK